MGFLTGKEGIISFDDLGKVSFCSNTPPLYLVTPTSEAVIGKSFFNGSHANYTFNDISSDTTFELATTAYQVISYTKDSLVIPFVKFSSADQHVAILDIIVDEPQASCRVVYAYTGTPPSLMLYSDEVVASTSTYGVEVKDDSGVLIFTTPTGLMSRAGTFTIDYSTVLDPIVDNAAKAIRAKNSIKSVTITDGTVFDYTKHAVYMPIGPYKGSTGKVDTDTSPKCGTEFFGTVNKYQRTKTSVKFWSTARAAMCTSGGVLGASYLNVSGGRVSATVKGRCLYGGAWGDIERVILSLVGLVNDIIFDDNSFSLSSASGYLPYPRFIRSPYTGNFSNIELNGLIINI